MGLNRWTHREEAMIYAKDMPVSESWRSGVDVDQTGLAEKVRNLLQTQLMEYSLGIESSSSGRIVVAKKCRAYLPRD